MRHITVSLLALAAVSAAACTPLQVGLAAVSLVTGGGGDQQVATSSPRADLMSALAGMDNTISPACQAKVDAVANDIPATSTEQSEPPLETCRLQLVCLPGAAAPVELMACAETVSAPDNVATTTVAFDTQPGVWSWQDPEPQAVAAAER